jgi:hypothetical protein
MADNPVRPGVASEYYVDPTTGQKYVLIKLGGTTTADGREAGLVESLPNEQVDIVLDAACDLMGIRFGAAGTVDIKFTNDSTAKRWTVTVGEIIYGRIIEVTTGGSVAVGDMIGLK